MCIRFGNCLVNNNVYTNFRYVYAGIFHYYFYHCFHFWYFAGSHFDDPGVHTADRNIRFWLIRESLTCCYVSLRECPMSESKLINTNCIWWKYKKKKKHDEARHTEMKTWKPVRFLHAMLISDFIFVYIYIFSHESRVVWLSALVAPRTFLVPTF